MPKKFYTLDDLYRFCKDNNFSKFSAKENGGPIVVQSLGEFEASEVSNQGLVPVTLQACHTELNRNNSFISTETMTNALSSFANKPILGYIHQLDDGTYDFYTHNISYVEDENTDDGVRVEYDERPIGVIPESCNAKLEYDENHDKTYVVVTGYIYEDYGNRAVEILQNNGGKTKVSVEIAVNEMSYNAKEGYLNIDDMYFMGVTCLGKTPDGEIVQEGMEGSNLKLDNFSVKENSMFSFDYSEKIVDLLSNINEKLDSLSNIQFDEKGVESNMNHFEELLELYGVTLEDIDFDYDNLTDEELDAKFEEVFKCKKKKCSDDEDEHAVQDEADEEDFKCKKKKCSDDEEEQTTQSEMSEEEAEDKKYELKYELSHDDIRSGLYELLAAQSDDGYWYSWIIEVYDNQFIYEDYIEGKCYKQSYVKDGDNIAFDGDKVEVFSEWLTKSEKDALEALKADYASLKQFKDNYDANVLKAQKEEVFNSAEYADIRDTEEFKSVINDAEKYSVDEIKIKCDLIFASHMKSKFSFAVNKEASKHTVGVNLNEKPKKSRKTYGGLFDN